MATVLRPVGHEEKLTLVEHLDELRTRLIIALAAYLVCFGVAFWQNDAVLDVVNRPVEQTAFQSDTTKDPLEQSARFQAATRDLAAAADRLGQALAADQDAPPAVRQSAEELRRAAAAAVEAAPETPTVRRPVTLGVAEPFFATFKVAAYAALLFSLPIMLWQMYAFVLPAFSPRERRVATPLMSAVPFLFMAGVAFAYFVVLPKAIDVLQNFNDDQFDILIQARDLYRFSILTCIAMGVLFQIPIAILLLVRMEIVSIAQLRANRRYAILVIAVLAMFLPGTDPLTMLLAMLPLVVLYEGSILLAAALNRRSERAAAGEASSDLPDDHDDDD